MPLVVQRQRYKYPPPPSQPFFPPDEYDYSIPGPPNERVFFTDASGNQIDLSTIPDVQYKQGIDGRFMGELEHFAEASPEQDGARYRGSRLVPSLVTVVLLVVAEDVVSLRTRMRELARGLYPKRGLSVGDRLGKLTVITEDGLERYVNCIFEGGFGADPTTEGFQYEQSVALNFRVFDPTWYEAKSVERTFISNANSGKFFPIFPVKIGASNIFAVNEEDNTGDELAWPVWSIQGPGSGLTLRNETTQEEMTLDYTLATTSRVVIDTRPDIKSVTESGDFNLFGELNGDLWPLIPGVNEIRILMSNTNDSTNISLQYQRRFAGV